MDLQLSGRRAIVTGGSAGIGRAVARALALEGVGVAVSSRSRARASEAIELANDTEYGLVAYCYTNDLSRSWRLAEALECGMVAFNTGRVSGEMAPFGGVKQSGLGREGSKYGLEEWLEVKYLNFVGING